MPVDGKRDPGRPHNLAGRFIQDHDINLRVVDLHDLVRPRDLVLSGSCNARTKQALLPSAGGANSFVDEEQPSLDGSPGRHGNTLLPAKARSMLRSGVLARHSTPMLRSF